VERRRIANEANEKWRNAVNREIVERRRIANEANEKWRNAVKECGHYLVPYPLTGLRGTSGKSV